MKENERWERYLTLFQASRLASVDSDRLLSVQTLRILRRVSVSLRMNEVHGHGLRTSSSRMKKKWKVLCNYGHFEWQSKSNHRWKRTWQVGDPTTQLKVVKDRRTEPKLQRRARHGDPHRGSIWARMQEWRLHHFDAAGSEHRVPERKRRRSRNRKRADFRNFIFFPIRKFNSRTDGRISMKLGSLTL